MTVRESRLVVVLALGALLSGCGHQKSASGPSPQDTAPAGLPSPGTSAGGALSTPSPSPTANPAAALAGSDLADRSSYQDPAGYTSFRSPTQNIGCSLSTTTASCQLAKFSYNPRLPSTCRGVGVWGSTIDLADAPQFVCATDTVAAGAKQLSYGSRVEVGQFVCVSHPDGVTCLNRSTDHGFKVSEQAYEFF